MSAANTTVAGDTYKAYLTIGENTNASNGFVSGEDAINLMSSVYDGENLHTPMALYTICDNQPLMYDRRAELHNIPVVFSFMSDNYSFAGRTILSFATQGKFSEPLYLHDALSGDSIMIVNGLRISVETPQSNQIRYFINGSKPVTSEENQQGTATGIEEVNDQSPITNYQSGTVIYDVLGRKIMTLNEYDLISNIHLPTGVYIIQRGSNTERMVIR
jgi:hypothetical protein